MSTDTEIEMTCDFLLTSIKIQNIIKNPMNIKPINKKRLSRNLH